MALAISSRTALCGVILHPASHTRSPAMHNAAFRTLGIDAAYVAFDVAPASLADAITGMRALGIRQLAVSVPHKIDVMAHLDEIDETATAIGAVNTVTAIRGQLIGSNSDWIGAVRALETQALQSQGDRKLQGCRAVVLGAGGAARAAVFGLLQRGCDVTVLNRTEARSRELCASLGAAASGALAELGDIPHDILVNTTTADRRSDASPVDPKMLRQGSVVLDAVYEPERTQLLRDAEEAGAKTVSGKWWLVHQAARQLELWTECEAPVEVMARAFDEA